VPLSDDEATTLRGLQARLRQDTRNRRVNGVLRLGFEALHAYYDGQRRLAQIGLAVPDELLREFSVFVAFPSTYADALTERQVVEGFRLPGQSEADSGLWEIWQANDLDAESAMARLDRTVCGRAYYCLGSNEDAPDMPLITVESPLQMAHEWSNRKRRTLAAARFYAEGDGTVRTREELATLYTDGATRWLRKGRQGWDVEDEDEHGFPCLVEPLINQPRAHDRYGQSQLLRIISLTDAACRALTVAGFATEALGAPARFAAGLTQADFKDPKTGEVLTQWEAYLGAIWTTANKDAKFGQFDAANLDNFATMSSHYAQMASGATGLPMRYFGQLSDNPPSADGIRADQDRMIRTCEAQNIVEASCDERVMAKAQMIRTGDVDLTLTRMETLFRDPATPTQAQAADAAVKKHAQGLVSRRQALQDMGYTDVQIGNIEKDLAREQASVFAAQIREAARVPDDADSADSA
jgi:hypothetical protein